MGAPLRRAVRADLDAIVALQHAAYEPNKAIIGVDPLPLLADYAKILDSCEVWLAPGAEGLEGVLILEMRPHDLLIWSVATAPTARGAGLGRVLLGHAERRARDLGKAVVRLYTGEKLTHNVAWYQRRGFSIERIEALDDRNLVHMSKRLL